jgi:hypothetical protein
MNTSTIPTVAHGKIYVQRLADAVEQPAFVANDAYG